MTEDEKIEWGKREFQSRLEDLKQVRAETMALEEAQKRARKRSRQSGMTPAVAYRYMSIASREMRAADTRADRT